jgi:hypothetical protein
VDAGNARVTFNDRVGALNTTYGAFLNKTADLSPYQLEVLAGSILINADITTFERQVYRGDVLIGDNGINALTRILLSEDPSIQFFGKVDDVLANTHTLKAMAVSIAGNEVPEIVFDSDVGSVAALAGLDVVLGKQNQDIGIAFSDTTIGDATQYVGNLSIAANVTTSGNQTYTANTINIGNQAVITPNTVKITSTSGSVIFRTGATGGIQGVGLNPKLDVLHGASGSVTGLLAPSVEITTGVYNAPAPSPLGNEVSMNNLSAAFFTSLVNRSVERNIINQVSSEVVEVGEVGLLANGEVKRLNGDDSLCDKSNQNECKAK